MLGLKFHMLRHPIIQLRTFDYIGLRFYEVNLWVFPIAYHLWTYSYTLDLSCPNRKRLEVSKNVKYIAVTTCLQSLVFLGFEPGPPTWVNFPMFSESHGGPGFKSQRSPTLETCNFEALEVAAMNFTFSETSSLCLFGQDRSRV